MVKYYPDFMVIPELFGYLIGIVVKGDSAMHLEALEKVLGIARKNPRTLLSPSFYEKICTRLDISTEQTPDTMTLKKNSRQVDVIIVNHENCAQYKCVMIEGKNGIRIFEFINAVVKLLTEKEIPPSPFEKMGQTADYYCEQGIKVLEEELLNK